MSPGGLAPICSGRRRSAVRRQHGATLVVVLLMLTVVMMVGVSAANIALHSEKASRNDRDRQIAFQAAEAALADAEMDIQGSPALRTMRSQLFDGKQVEGFTKGCGAGLQDLYLGLCVPDGNAGPVWQEVDFTDSSTRTNRTLRPFYGTGFPGGGRIAAGPPATLHHRADTRYGCAPFSKRHGWNLHLPHHCSWIWRA